MKTLKIFAVAIALMCVSGVSYAQSLEEASNKYAEGVEKLKAKSYNEAIASLKDAYNISVELGEEGLEVLKEVKTLIPKAYLQKGMVSLQSKNYDEGIKDIEEAKNSADLYGDTQIVRQANRYISTAYQAKGAEAFNNKDYKTALESFSKGYEQDPSNVKLASLTAKSYAELGDLSQAITVYQSVIEAGEKNSRFADDAEAAKKDISTYLMIAMQTAADEKKIEKVIELADLAPQNPEVQMLAIQTANNMKKLDVLVARAAAAAEVQTDADMKSNIYYMLGVAYNNLNDNTKAVQALGKVTSGANAAAARQLASELKK